MDAGITINANTANINNTSAGFSLSFMPNKYGGLTIGTVILGILQPELIPILSRMKP